MKIFLILFFLFFISCEKNPLTKYKGVALSIPYKIIFQQSLNKETRLLIKETIENTFEEIDSKLNHWNKNSEISKWNNSPSLNPIKISKLLYQLLQICDTSHKNTSGKFDPSLGKMIQLWKRTPYFKNPTP